MNDEIKELLLKIQIMLIELNRFKAFRAYYGGMGRYEVLADDVVDLNFTDLIKKIDEVLENESF